MDQETTFPFSPWVLDPQTPEWRKITLHLPLQSPNPTLVNGRMRAPDPDTYTVRGKISFQKAGAPVYCVWNSPGFQGEVTRLLLHPFATLFEHYVDKRDVRFFSYACPKEGSPASFSLDIKNGYAALIENATAHVKTSFMHAFHLLEEEQKTKRARFNAIAS